MKIHGLQGQSGLTPGTQGSQRPSQKAAQEAETQAWVAGCVAQNPEAGELVLGSAEDTGPTGQDF